MRTLLLAVLAALVLASPAAAAPQWLAPVDIQPDIASAVEGDVAVAPDGTTMAVWVAKVGDRSLARARVRLPGQGFGPTIDLTPATGFDAIRVRVAVDQASNFTVAWDENTAPATNRRIRAARFPVGASGFEPIETVSDAADAFSPVIAVGGAGTAVIAYHEGGNLRAAIRPGAGGEFNAATTLTPLDNFTDPQLAVDDAGNAIALWSREAVAGSLRVQALQRQPGGGFGGPADVITLSRTGGTDQSRSPSLAMTPDGRAVVVWQYAPTAAGSTSIEVVERAANGTWSTPPALASKPGEQAINPHVGVAADGTALGTWQVDIGGSPFLQAASRPFGGAFGGHRNIAAGSTNPTIAMNRAGDAMIVWNGSMGEGVFAVRRPAGGTFGGVENVALGTQGSADPAISLFLQDVGVDNQGNATALWQRASASGSTMTFLWRLQAASFDAAPPTITALSVPTNGAPGSPIGMAATAFDRLSSPALAWSFGDGATATGPAVTHSYAAGGAYTVTVTATDGAGNATSASSAVVIAPGPPPKKKRINSKVKISWGVTSTRIFLIRLKIPKTPKKTKAVLTCKGKQCPFKRVSSKKRRKRAITLFKEVKTSQVRTMKKRTFRPGQRVELRITAPGYIGQVLRYKLKRAKVPIAKKLCLPVGAKKPRKRCP